MIIKELTRKISREEVEQAIERNGQVTGYVALDPYCLLELTMCDFLDLLETEVTDCYVSEIDDMNVSIMDYNHEYGALVFEVTIMPREID
jgi:hypothetical protein